MKADLVLTHIPAAHEKWKDRAAIVVDVLRASTSICQALNNGAKHVIPVDSVPAAMELAASMGRDSLKLCGEREGKLIEGFDLGNSPYEYTEEAVAGKPLVFCSTNGSTAIVRAAHAIFALVCGFVNISACAKRIKESKHDILIVCAGNEGQFALEDTVCGGMLLDIILDGFDGEVEMNDGAEAALILYRNYSGQYLKLMQKCRHGKYLKSLGYENDLSLCADVDKLSIVPILKEGKIILDSGTSIES